VLISANASKTDIYSAMRRSLPNLGLFSVSFVDESSEVHIEIHDVQSGGVIRTGLGVTSIDHIVKSS